MISTVAHHSTPARLPRHIHTVPAVPVPAAGEVERLDPERTDIPRSAAQIPAAAETVRSPTADIGLDSLAAPMGIEKSDTVPGMLAVAGRCTVLVLAVGTD